MEHAQGENRQFGRRNCPYNNADVQPQGSKTKTFSQMINDGSTFGTPFELSFLCMLITFAAIAFFDFLGLLNDGKNLSVYGVIKLTILLLWIVFSGLVHKYIEVILKFFMIKLDEIKSQRINLLIAIKYVTSPIIISFQILFFPIVSPATFLIVYFLFCF